jgi:hypothetical protein
MNRLQLVTTIRIVLSRCLGLTIGRHPNGTRNSFQRPDHAEPRRSMSLEAISESFF